MRRRDFIAGASALLSSASAVRAQPSAKPPLLGFLYAAGRKPNEVYNAAFLEGMRKFGYAEGSDFAMAYRYADEDYARLGALAGELVALNPALILAAEPPSSLALTRATSSIPLIGVLLAYPVEQGLAKSYARPTGNLTGLLVVVSGMWGKQFEFAHALAPQAKAIGLLLNPTNFGNISSKPDVERAASAAGVSLVVAEATTRDAIAPALKKLVESTQAILVGSDATFVSERSHICTLLAELGTPAVFGNREFVDAGGLMSYSTNNVANYARSAYYADRILKGGNPAEMPIEFPTKIELIVNMKTAKALGLTVPSTLLATADQVIE